MNLTPATIQFNDQGTPMAEAFDDVYFSNASGLDESRYVFQRQNGLPERWGSHRENRFVVAETGFGTGLNFLALYQRFAEFIQGQDASICRHLHFVSVEKFPLSRTDLAAALAQWTELQVYAENLIQQYPPAIPGCHRLIFENGSVVLDLWFGEVAEVFPQLHNHPNGLVDAWFLDGFAPSKNPDMWTDTLFQQMARLSKADGTFATFTAAGAVKRGLRQAGFSVDKRPGFGRKREMLAGSYAQPAECESPTRQLQGGYQRLGLSSPANTGDIAIVGAGLAAANLSYSLAQRGIASTVYHSAKGPADAASGNPQGGFYPQLNAQFNHASQLQVLSYLYARRRYDQVLDAGCHFDHDWCGVLQLAFNDNTLSRYQNMMSKDLWPSDIMTWLDPQHASRRARIHIPHPGLWFAQAGWINPPGLVHALFAAARQRAQVKLVPMHHLSGLTRSHDAWTLSFSNGSQRAHKQLVLATGADTLDMDIVQGLPLQAVRGQVEHIPANESTSPLKTVLCHKGYFCPSYRGYHALGSTYGKNDRSRDFRPEDTQLNLSVHQRAMAGSDWIDSLSGPGQGRASVRCTTPDHVPLVGAMPDLPSQCNAYEENFLGKPIATQTLPEQLDGLYLLTGFGSRALTTAPLAAELLTSQVLGEPLPLSNPLLQALNPNRFLLRQLSKHPDHRAARHGGHH